LVVEWRDDVGAQLERALKVRRHERVVDTQISPCRLARSAIARDVDQLEHRVGRRLEPQQLACSA
jgi:hypothetical protein